MQNDSMTLIFRTIFGNFLERFSAECKALAEPIVAATVGMYNTILTDLRPTPAKSHYTYNLRDLSKVFQVTKFRSFLFFSGHTDSFHHNRGSPRNYAKNQNLSLCTFYHLAAPAKLPRLVHTHDHTITRRLYHNARCADCFVLPLLASFHGPQGMLMMDHRRVSTAADLCRVWVHETRRVFADRLISYEDKGWFEDLAEKQGCEHLGLDWDETIGAPGTPRSFLMYADFLIPGAEPKVR